jgi:tetratricopeptide (TPR) repeat protein
LSLRATDAAAAAENFQKAIDTQRGVAIDRPMLTNLLVGRAAVLRELNNPAEAVDCLREAFDISRGHAEAETGPHALGPDVILYYLGCTQRQLGDSAAAERLLREAAETCDPRRPERPLAWIDWIDLLLELHTKSEPGEAEKWIEKLADGARQIELFRNESPTIFNRIGADLAAAALAIARGELDAAEPLIQSAVDTSRNEAGIRGSARALGRAECFRADVLIRRGRFREAERLLLLIDRAAWADYLWRTISSAIAAIARTSALTTIVTDPRVIWRCTSGGNSRLATGPHFLHWKEPTAE